MGRFREFENSPHFPACCYVLRAKRRLMVEYKPMAVLYRSDSRHTAPELGSGIKGVKNENLLAQKALRWLELNS